MGTTLPALSPLEENQMIRSVFTSLVLTAAALVAQPASNSAITTTGQELTVTLGGIPAALDPSITSVLATCDATLGAPQVQPVNVIFVFDVSGSMASGVSGAGISDFNMDGFLDRIDAAGLGFVSLLGSIGGASVDVGIVTFGASAINADVGAAGGIQLFTTPGTDSNSNGQDDIVDVLAAHDTNVVNLFTPFNVGNTTNYNAALAAANAALATQPAGEPSFVFFLTDGAPTVFTPPGGGGPLDATIAAGTIVTTIGIGPGVAGACAPGGALDLISSSTGGVCIEEPDPSNLSASLPTSSSTEITSLTLRVNGSDGASVSGMLGLMASSGPDEIFPLLVNGPNLIECVGTAADGTTVTASRTLEPMACILIDFETEDDFATALVNGQSIQTPGEFGVLVSVTGSGANAGASIFDSSPMGPNAGGLDPDLLVDKGNILILQSLDATAQTVPGIFDAACDSRNGGTITFDFVAAVAPASIALIDIDASPLEAGSVVLTDVAGAQRVYDVPPQWTGDIAVDGGTGFGVLDLQDTAPQPGLASTVTASETAGFDPSAVVRIEVNLGRSGGVDDLKWFQIAPAQASAEERMGSGANPHTLLCRAVPVIGSSFELDLDCSAHSPIGISALFVYEAPIQGVMLPGLGEWLLGGLPLLQYQGGTGSLVTFSQAIPAVAQLAGLELHAQGICFAEPTPQLSNAMKLTFGW
jgi:hypothetical protein